MSRIGRQRGAAHTQHHGMIREHFLSKDVGRRRSDNGPSISVSDGRPSPADFNQI